MMHHDCDVCGCICEPCRLCERCGEPDTCGECDGRGTYMGPGYAYYDCPRCHGAGVIRPTPPPPRPPRPRADLAGPIGTLVEHLRYNLRQRLRPAAASRATTGARCRSLIAALRILRRAQQGGGG